MPEGDTVWRTAQRLNQAFAGSPLTVSDLRWPELSTLDFRSVMTTEVVSRGKHLLHRLASGWTIHSHLRMEGSWRIVRTRDARPAGHAVRAVLATTEWTAHGVRLGMLDVVRTDQEATLVGHLGPDLLGPDWGDDALDVAVSNLLASPDSLGAALLDQTNLAGIGTLWAAESLFLERVDPWASPSTLGETVVRRVVVRARRLLDANRQHAIQSSTGSRQAGHEVYLHGRAGRPCRRCGNPVQVDPIGPPLRQRVLFHCPTCQPALPSA